MKGVAHLDRPASARQIPSVRTSLILLLALLPQGVPAQERDLGSCLAALRATRPARRVSAEIWERHTRDLTLDRRVLQQLDAQPEVRLPVWDYLAVMVDGERIDDGRRLMGEHRALLDELSAKYGVDPHLLVAIWGIESDFGRGTGSFDVLRSLATLSCSGRRQAYFRRELLAALRIVQAGHVEADRFRGSWAGAFGQTQFMPGTFEWLAVDHDGDGRCDVLGSVGDALASTANFLRTVKWKEDAPWGMEVRLPAPPFATRNEGRRVKRTLATWAARGLRRVDGSPLAQAGLPSSTRAGLFLTAGVRGPAFLVFHNFDVIHRYNASERYSLAIGHLADRLRGGGPFVTPWPTDDLGLSRADRRELQRLLAQRGHEVGSPTAVLTTRVLAAVRAEQRRLGHEVTGRPGQRLLEALRTQ